MANPARLAAPLALGIALAGALASAPASADDSLMETKSLAVRYGDLDLTTDAGAAALDARVHRAVRLVCGEVDRTNLSTIAAVDACRRAALGTAEPQVVLALEAAHSGKALASADRAIAVPGS